MKKRQKKVVGPSLFDALDAPLDMTQQDSVAIDLTLVSAAVDARIGLPTDAASPLIPEALSDRTFISTIRTDEPAPTVQAGKASIGDACQNVFIYVPHISDPEKPPYRIPLMAEIAAVPKNGLVVVSTFSGCGGSCLGFKMAGYRVLWANEFIPAAQDTYRANYPETYLDVSDIRTVTAESIRSVIGDVEIDVFEGSPPCASFSTAGKMSKGWGEVRPYSDTKQRTDDLFGQYVRLLDGLRPRAFVAENVSGMVKGVSKGHFKKYLGMFRNLPYNVEARLLDAQYLGVPQRRVRLIFVGVRKDVGRPVWPKKLPYAYSVRDAIPWIARVTSEQHGLADVFGFIEDRMYKFTEAGKSGLADKTEIISLNLPLPTVRQSANDQFRIVSAPSVIYHPGFSAQAPREIIDEPRPTVKVGVNGLCSTHFLVGGDGPGDADTRVSRKGLDDALIEGSHGFDRHAYRTVDAPLETIQASRSLSVEERVEGGVASVAHPYERRKFTIAELRRICGFPDDFILTGTYAKQWERLGRAVPPPMMRAVAEALAPVLLASKEKT